MVVNIHRAQRSTFLNETKRFIFYLLFQKMIQPTTQAIIQTKLSKPNIAKVEHVQKTLAHH